MRRLLLTTAVAAVSLAAIPAQQAAATSVSSGASAFSSAGYTGTARLNANLTLSGSLGGLLNGLIGPIVSGALNPLVAALQGNASDAVAGVLGPASSLSASTPTTQGGSKPASFPNDLPTGLPNPCTPSSAIQPCYRATSMAPVNVAPLANVAVSAASGYTQQTPTAADATSPIFGRAQIGGAQIAVLSGASSIANPALTVGTIDSMANCPNDGSTAPTASVSAANVSILGGAVTLSVANGAIASIRANGNTYATLDDLPTLTFSGLTVQPYGDALAVTLPLSLAQVIGALGLPSSVSTPLLTYGVTGTALNLTFVIGPNSAITNTTALAWGLGVGVDLSGSLSFNLLGLIGATVTVPTGIAGPTFGNILDLRLAYSNCQSGSISTGGTLAIPLQFV